MAREPFNLLTALLQSRRVVEWTILSCVLIGLVWGLEHESRVVRGQGERVAVRATLSSLRASLVIDHLTAQLRSPRTPAATSREARNPFLLLQQVPPNYAGELAMRNIYSVPPGSWVFDPECGCVGYRLLYAQWLEPPQEAETMWFRVTQTGDAPGLMAMSEYDWFGQRVN